MIRRLAYACLLAAAWRVNAGPAPDTPKFTAGLALYRAGDCTGALREFDASSAALENAPERPFYQGACLAKQGEWSRASQRLAPYAAAHSGEFRAWYWLAQAQLYGKQFAQARESITNAISLDSSSADALRTLGEIEYERRDHDAAYRAWIQANRLNPSDARVTYCLGRLFFEADFPNEAAAWFRQTLKTAPDHFAAMTYLAMCAERLNMDNTAIDLYRAAIRQSKRQGKPYAWAFTGLGKLLRQFGKDDEALAVLEEEEKTCPDAHGLTVLGQLLASRNQNARAEATLRRAIGMDPTIPDAHYRLALLLRAGGRTAEAQSEMQNFQATKAAEQRNSVKVQAIRKQP